MGTVVVLGSLITDLVARAPRLPLVGESLIGDGFDIFLGGKGINQAIAAKRLGAQVTLVGRVGTDSFGDAFFPVLEEEGLSGTYLERDETAGTGVSLVIIDNASGQNAIVANPRANFTVPATTVIAALDEAMKGHQDEQHPGVFLTQCETSRISYHHGLKRARELGMVTILNVAPIPRDPIDDTLLQLVDILVVNEVEAAALTQVIVVSPGTARQAGEQLLGAGSQHVLITLGAQGCLWSTRQQGNVEHQVLPALPVKAVDTTAAGDTFCGALAASLSAGYEMQEALRRAIVASAITVTRQGAIAALPYAHEVEEMLKQA